MIDLKRVPEKFPASMCVPEAGTDQTRKSCSFIHLLSMHRSDTMPSTLHG